MAADMPPAPAVRFEGVGVRCCGRRILNAVDAEAPAGGSTVLVGPNGAGKTTLLRCLLGEQAHTGRILFDGVPRMPRTAYVPQQLQMDRGLPLLVEEFLALHRRRPLWWGGRGDGDAPARELLEQVRAARLARRRMGDLSGGELRRVLLAAALLRQPQLLILDEPEAGVDIRGERLFWELLDAARRARGFTQIMVSHNLPLVAHYATHVICLNRRVRAEGAPRATLSSSLLLELFGVPIHLYPDQCDPGNPGCPHCGAACPPAMLARLHGEARHA